MIEKLFMTLINVMFIALLVVALNDSSNTSKVLTVMSFYIEFRCYCEQLSNDSHVLFDCMFVKCKEYINIPTYPRFVSISEHNLRLLTKAKSNFCSGINFCQEIT